MPRYETAPWVENIRDMSTKHVPGNSCLEQHMRRLGLEVELGCAVSAPTLGTFTSSGPRSTITTCGYDYNTYANIFDVYTYCLIRIEGAESAVEGAGAAPARCLPGLGARGA